MTHKEPQTNLATEIRAARQTLGLTQQQASKAWDVPLPTLRQWEQRVHKPRGLALKMLRSILTTAMAAKSAA
jgi:DNA-binding transcriptional regulator YiaG